MSTETYAREGVQTPVPNDRSLDEAMMTPRSATPARGNRVGVAPRRPGGIIFIAVIAWLGAVAEILTGILALTGVLHAEAVSTEMAWIAIVVGVVSSMITFFLFSGRNAARILVTVSFTLTLLTSIFAVITHPANFVALTASGIGAIIGLALLYTRRANAYFAR